jgi:hypothetical protein
MPRYRVATTTGVSILVDAGDAATARILVERRYGEQVGTRTLGYPTTVTEQRP